MDEIVLSKLEAKVYLAVACEAENIGDDKYRWQGNLLDIAQTVIPDTPIAKRCLHSLIFRKRLFRPLVESKLAGAFIDVEEKVETSRNHLYQICVTNYTVRGEVSNMAEKKRLRRKPDFNPDEYYKITAEQVEQVFQHLCELPTDQDGWITGGVYRPLKERHINEHVTRPATRRLITDGQLERKGSDHWRVKKIVSPESMDEQLLARIDARINEKRERIRQQEECITKLQAQLGEARSTLEVLSEHVSTLQNARGILA